MIRELGQEAARDDITIGLEFVNRYESNLLNTARQTLEVALSILDKIKEHADVVSRSLVSGWKL